MGQGARLPAHQGTLGLRRPAHRGSFRLREWRDDSCQWFRSHGNENWQFTAQGYMEQRHASINDRPIHASERLFHWPSGPLPADHPGLTALGL